MSEYNFNLEDAIKCGIIDPAYIQEQLEMNRRKELLKKHPYKVWQGTDGYWNTYIPTETGRARKKKRTLPEIENLIIGYIEDDTDDTTVKDVFVAWVERRYELKKISSGTRERDYQIFNKHFQKFGKKKIRNLTKNNVVDFLEEQIPEHNLSAKAFANLKSVMKGILLRAKKEGYIEWSVSDMFEELDVSDREFRHIIKEDYQEVFNEEETEKIIKYLEQKLDPQNIAILFTFVTGLRVGELVTLKHEDFTDFSVLVRRTETRVKKECGVGYDYLIKDYPKTRAGIREVVIPDEYLWIINLIHSINPNGEYVFVKKNERMTTNVVRRRLDTICKNLDIPHKSPHKIRKTYGSILMDNNIDSNMIIQLMGHTDIACSEKHYHRNRKNIDKKREIISCIPDFMVEKKLRKI